MHRLISLAYTLCLDINLSYSTRVGICFTLLDALLFMNSSSGSSGFPAWLLALALSSSCRSRLCRACRTMGPGMFFPSFGKLQAALLWASQALSSLMYSLVSLCVQGYCWWALCRWLTELLSSRCSELCWALLSSGDWPASLLKAGVLAWVRNGADCWENRNYFQIFLSLLPVLRQGSWTWVALTSHFGVGLSWSSWYWFTLVTKTIWVFGEVKRLRGAGSTAQLVQCLSYIHVTGLWWKFKGLFCQWEDWATGRLTEQAREHSPCFGSVCVFLWAVCRSVHMIAYDMT